MKARLLLPLGIFVVLVAFLAIGLKLDPREVPSPLVGKPAPDFSAPTLMEPGRIIAKQDMLGKVWMLNVFASWCVACREEHPLLVAYARTPGAVPVIGLNYKDKREDGQAWLGRFGNPYTDIVFDLNGRIGINYGVYGVPETFIIDKAGVIRYKQIGPITPEALRNKIEPLLRQLNV
jgi:cytochrome c biogenesis protein CcmG/thiol:disulfide interchange protein DsbE